MEHTLSTYLGGSLKVENRLTRQRPQVVGPQACVPDTALEDIKYRTGVGTDIWSDVPKVKETHLTDLYYPMEILCSLAVPYLLYRRRVKRQQFPRPHTAVITPE